MARGWTDAEPAPAARPAPPRTCINCEGLDFERRRGVLDTRGFAFMGWTWANRGCTEFICMSCGYVMTFADDPARAKRGIATPDGYKIGD